MYSKPRRVKQVLKPHANAVHHVAQKSPRKASHSGEQPAIQKAPTGARVEPTEQLHPVIVSIGTSVSGLETLCDLFSCLSDDMNIAFVVVQHLAPSHEILMADLLVCYARLAIP